MSLRNRSRTSRNRATNSVAKLQRAAQKAMPAYAGKGFETLESRQLFAIVQAAEADYLAWEAEDLSGQISDPDGDGRTWVLITPSTTPSTEATGTPVDSHPITGAPVGKEVSGTGALMDDEAQNVTNPVGGIVSYKLQFDKPGFYKLYTRRLIRTANQPAGAPDGNSMFVPRTLDTANADLTNSGAYIEYDNDETRRNLYYWSSDGAIVPSIPGPIGTTGGQYNGTTINGKQINGVVYNVTTAGEHTITFANRERGYVLDRIVLQRLPDDPTNYNDPFQDELDDKVNSVSTGLAAPAAPANLSSVVSNNIVRLRFERAFQAATYDVLRSTTPGGGYTVIADNITTNQFDDTTAVNGTTYYYVVRAANAAGESANSTELTATPANVGPAAPTNVTAQPIAGNPRTMRITYTAPDFATAYNIQRADTATGALTNVATGVTGTSFDDTTIPAGAVVGEDFYYVVTPVSATGVAGTPSSARVAIVGAGLFGQYYNDGFWGFGSGQQARPAAPLAGAPAAGYPFSAPFPASTIRVMRPADVRGQFQPQVAFDWGTGSPHPAIRGDNHSTLWVGKIVTNAAGDYQILGYGDDDTHVFVNGQLASSNPGGHGIQDPRDPASIARGGGAATLSLAANTEYDIVLLQAEQGGGSGVFLRWVQPGSTSADIVPSANLRGVTAAPAAATALATAGTSTYNEISFTFAEAVTNELRFDLERREVGNTSDAAWIVVGHAGINQTNVTDYGAIPGVAYEYRVRGWNVDPETGEGRYGAPSNVVTATAAAPTAAAGMQMHLYNDQWWKGGYVPSRSNAGNDITAGRNPDLTRSVGALDENWGTNAPVPGVIRPDEHSTISQAKITFAEAGTYNLYGYGDDDTYVWVDSQLVSADPGGHGIPNVDRAGDFGLNDIPVKNAITITAEDIAAGRNVRNVTVAHSEGGGGSGVFLRWYTPSTPRTAGPVVVPESAMTNVPDAPTAPTGLAAPTAVSDAVILTWTDTAKSEVRYVIERANAATPNNFVQVGMAPINGGRFVDTTVAANTQYVYRVSAENFVGAGRATLNVGTTIPTAPPAPTNLTASENAGAVTLTFTDNALNESGYIIERQGSDGVFRPVSTSPLAGNAPGATGTRTFVDGDPALQPGQTYVYRVRAANRDGMESENAQITTTSVTGLEQTFYDQDFYNATRNFVPGNNPFDPLVRRAATVNDNWGTGAPDPRISVDLFSVAYEGVLTPTVTGDYTFYGTSDDGIRIFINGQMVVDAWVDRGPTETASTLPPVGTGTPASTVGGIGATTRLTAGTAYSFQVSYYENGGGAMAEARWSATEGGVEVVPKQIIPAANLSAPNASGTLFAPTNVNATNANGTNPVLGSCATVTWIDGNSNETGFRVERSTSATFASDVTVAGTVPANQTIFYDEGGAAGTAYYYRVVPLNGSASGPASAPTATAITTGTQAMGGAASYANFASTEGLTLGGNATATDTNNRLRLTNNANGQTGSAFLTDPRNVGDGFLTTFDFVIGEGGAQSGNPADGFAFIIQKAGNNVRGDSGGGLGWSGAAFNSGSVGVKFDIYNNIDQTGLYFNGEAISDDPNFARNRQVRPMFDLNNGQPLRVTLNYDAAKKELYQTIDDINNPATAPFVTTYSLDLEAVIGSSCAYVGFTGATGGENARQEILNFSFTPTPAGAPTLSVNDVTATEGSNGTVTVTLSQASTNPVTVDYFTTNASGTSPADFTAGSGTLTFAPGETSKTITVPIATDAANEADEAFFVDLRNAVNAAIQDSRGRVIIPIGDAPPAARIEQVYVKGSAWNARFLAELVEEGVGTAEYGYRVDNLDTTAANSTLPWINTNQIVLVYDRDLGPGGIPGAGSILLDGVRHDYTVTAVTPLGTRAVVLTLDRPLGNNPGGAGADGDRVTLSVPGGAPTGTYSKMLNVLQGDANRQGNVVNSFGDLAFVRARLNRSAENEGTGATYTPWADLNASGDINSFVDLAAVRARLNDNLPPAGGAGAAGGVFSEEGITDLVLA